MNLKHYLILMSLGAGLCWLAWIIVLISTAPAEATALIFFFFYGSLFLALLGTVAVIGFLIRHAIVKDDAAVFRHVRHTFWQGIFAAFAGVTALILLSQNLLRWWNAILLVLLLIGVEFLLAARGKTESPPYV